MKIPMLRMAVIRMAAIALCSGALCALPLMAQDTAPATPRTDGAEGRDMQARQLEMMTRS
jgi:hypothetical protein